MSQESKRLYGILAATAGAATALNTITHAPRNEAGADLFMQTQRLEIRD